MRLSTTLGTSAPLGLKRTVYAGVFLMAIGGPLSCNKKQARRRPESRPAEASFPARAPLREPEIRVAVLKDARTLRLRAGTGPARIIGGDGRVLRNLSEGEEARLAVGGSGLTLDGVPAPSPLQVESRAPEYFLKLNGKELAPRVTVYRDPARGGSLTVVARLPLETYLLGVLAGEVPYRRWHAEALKAQAVASRGYALYQMKVHAREAYDVESTVQSQVFRPGYRKEPILRAAVSATRGRIVTYRGRLFPAYFHSTSGGHTEPVQAVFPGQEAIEPLSGVPSPYSADSPVHRWTLRLSKEALRRKLAQSPEARGRKIGALRTLRFIKGSASPRRAQRVQVEHALGRITLPAPRFRVLVGTGKLRSVWIERVRNLATEFEIHGRGFGHGVGLCQYGAQGMAQRGYSYEEILGHYYPGGALTRLYGDTLAARP